MNNKKDKNNCPSFRSLNAYVDNELSFDSPDFLHINNCDECQKKVQKLKKFNQMLSSALLHTPGAEFISEKCIEAVSMKRKNKMLRHQTYTQIIIKAAAAIAIFAGVSLYYLLSISNSGDEKNQILTRKEKIPLNRQYTQQNEQNKPTDSPYAAADNKERYALEKHSMSPLNSFNIADIETTGSGTQNNPIAQNIQFQNDNEEKAAEIPFVVRHNWIWTDKNKKPPELDKLLRKHKLSKASNDTITIVLTKEELVKLVRELQTSGFELLTDQEPQPETKLFRGKPTDKVEYQAKFIL